MTQRAFAEYLVFKTTKAVFGVVDRIENLKYLIRLSPIQTTSVSCICLRLLLHGQAPSNRQASRSCGSGVASMSARVGVDIATLGRKRARSLMLESRATRGRFRSRLRC
jgi:hypothetical protein